MADHGLRMHRRLRVGRELAHRGRAAEALGARPQLGQDLLVAVALADAGSERVQTLRIDTGDLGVPAAFHHFVPSFCLVPSVTDAVQPRASIRAPTRTGATVAKSRLDCCVEGLRRC